MRYIGTIEVEFELDGTRYEASDMVTNMCEYLVDSFNDDGSIFQCGQSRPVRVASEPQEDLVPELLPALIQAKRLIDEAFPKFNWAMSALDANAIRLLNETPRIVEAAIAKATTEGKKDGRNEAVT